MALAVKILKANSPVLLLKNTTYKPGAEATNAIRASGNKEKQQVKFFCYNCNHVISCMSQLHPSYSL